VDTQHYVGIDADAFGGMTAIGRVIRDAWIFSLIPETESCRGWDGAQIERLYASVSEAWERFGHLVSRLPPELRARHARVHDEAMARARTLGWAPDLSDEDDE
jgi:hypothetical protein